MGDDVVGAVEFDGFGELLIGGFEDARVGEGGEDLGSLWGGLFKVNRVRIRLGPLD